MPDEPLIPSATERFIARSVVDEAGVGKPLSERARHRQRTVESYLRGETLPKYIQRLADIEKAMRRHDRELHEAWRELRAIFPDDDERFAREWQTTVDEWDFREVNELIRQHNAWYPIERDLPMDPRTGDYVLVSGRPYRRAELDAAWALRRRPVS